MIPKIYRTQEAALQGLEMTYERDLLKAYRLSLTATQNELAKLYRSMPEITFADAQKYGRLASLERQIIEEMRGLAKKTGRTMTKAQESIYAESYYRTAFVTEKLAQAKLSYVLLDTKAVKKAIENPLDRVGFLQRNKDNIEQMTRQLSQELTRGIIQGEGYRDTAKRINDRFDIGANNALRIARTENHRVVSQGKLDAFAHAENVGVVLTKRWVSAIDTRTRPDHQDADGQVVQMKEPFKVGGESLQYPGDPAGGAANVINCRCTYIGEVEGYKPEFRRVQGEGVVPYTTYKEWAKDKGI